VGGVRRAVPQERRSRDERRRPRQIFDGQPAKHRRAAQPHGARRPCCNCDRRAGPPFETRHDDGRGRHVWRDLALPKIHTYYEEILADFSINDAAHMLHYLLKILENMQRLDAASSLDRDEDETA